MLVLFARSLWLCRDAEVDPGVVATVLSAAGAALALLTGWLGGELVDRLGVGVTPGAHVDVPSPLTHETVPGAGEIR